MVVLHFSVVSSFNIELKKKSKIIPLVSPRLERKQVVPNCSTTVATVV